MSNDIHPNPQERLAASRKAIVRHMNRHSEEAEVEERDEQREYADSQASGSVFGGAWGIFKHTLQSWWRHHPANVAFDFAKPVLRRYAEDQPVKLLGIAAGIGALAVVIKPWRLVSLGGVLLATLKSSEVSSALLSMLSQPPGGKTAAVKNQTTHPRESV